MCVEFYLLYFYILRTFVFNSKQPNILTFKQDGRNIQLEGYFKDSSNLDGFQIKDLVDG